MGLMCTLQKYILFICDAFLIYTEKYKKNTIVCIVAALALGGRVRHVLVRVL